MSGAIEISDRKIEKPNKYDIARETEKKAAEKSEAELKMALYKSSFESITNRTELQKQLNLTKQQWEYFNGIQGEDGRTAFVLHSISKEWARV